MLEHLVRVHDVERPVRQVEGVHVAGRELDVVDAGVARRVPRAVEHLARAIDAEHASGCDTRREVDGDRARTTTDVEHARARRQRVEQVRGRVLRGAPLVRTQDALVVAVRVDVVGRVHSGSGRMPAGSKNARSAVMRPSSSNTRWSTIGASTSRSAP